MMRLDLMQRVQTRMRRTPPWTTARTRCRFASNRLAVTLLAWLRLRPTAPVLPQISHSFGIRSLEKKTTEGTALCGPRKPPSIATSRTSPTLRRLKQYRAVGGDGLASWMLVIRPMYRSLTTGVQRKTTRPPTVWKKRHVVSRKGTIGPIDRVFRLCQDWHFYCLAG